MNAKNKLFSVKVLALIAAMAVLLFAGIGITGVAAQSSIPGDALYPVKTTLEQTRLSLAKDAGNRAQLKMSFAEKRLEEISALIQEGRYMEINTAVLAFEADINGAILELETVTKGDPARAASIAMEITSALTRYAQTLSVMAANAPESVRSEIARALDSTHTANSLDMPSDDVSDETGVDDSINDNANDNANDNSDDESLNDNGDDANDNSDDESLNDNGDDANDNSDDRSINDNGDDSTDDNDNNESINDNSSNNNDDGRGDESLNNNGDDSNDNSGGDSVNDNGDDSNDTGGGDTVNDNGGNDSSGHN